MNKIQRRIRLQGSSMKPIIRGVGQSDGSDAHFLLLVPLDLLTPPLPRSDRHFPLEARTNLNEEPNATGPANGFRLFRKNQFPWPFWPALAHE
jgi:hypothetical protein